MHVASFSNYRAFLSRRGDFLLCSANDACTHVSGRNGHLSQQILDCSSEWPRLDKDTDCATCRRAFFVRLARLGHRAPVGKVRASCKAEIVTSSRLSTISASTRAFERRLRITEALANVVTSSTFRTCIMLICCPSSLGFMASSLGTVQVLRLRNTTRRITFGVDKLHGTHRLVLFGAPYHRWTCLKIIQITIFETDEIAGLSFKTCPLEHSTVFMTGLSPSCMEALILRSPTQIFRL